MQGKEATWKFAGALRTPRLPLAQKKMLAAAAFCVTILGGILQGFGQEIYTPPSPISPRSMAECDHLQTEFSKFHSQVSSLHQGCLDANRKGQQAKDPLVERAQRCSIAACQSLHDKVYRPYYSGSAQVSACRQTVQQFIDVQKQRDKERQAEAKRKLEEQEAAEDLRKRHENQNKADLDQAARNAKAREDAIANDKWHADHDAAEAQKQNQMKSDHAARTSAQQEQQKRIDAATSSNQRKAWEAREKDREKQERAIQAKLDKMLDAALDEDQRAALTHEAVTQFNKVQQERDQDKEPK
jgi:hypothetical protein